jgi:WD40-like Beta Propeller Repeat
MRALVLVVSAGIICQNNAVYVQNRAGKYVSPQIENKGISQSPIREEHEVSVQNGNICISNAGGEVKTLTSSGRDSEPVLSPDGKWIVFVRTVPGKTISTGSGDADVTELWQIRADGKDPTALIRSKDSDKMETILAGFSKPQFSTNGRLVYFLSEAWATFGALHVVDTTNGKEHFVCPGLDFEVVRSGEYRDCLLVAQHRYFISGGTYDWFWLLRPDGKEVGPVGEDTENFKATYEKD